MRPPHHPMPIRPAAQAQKPAPARYAAGPAVKSRKHAWRLQRAPFTTHHECHPMNALADVARIAAHESLPHLNSLFGLEGQPAHERVLLVADEASGLKTILAVHSTARGPAFGGCRF
jgi:hypothetical protein